MPEADTDIGFVNRLISASIGSIITSLLVTPLDVIKTRMQIQSQATPTTTNGQIIDPNNCKSPENPAECEICYPNQQTNGKTNGSKTNGTSNGNTKLQNGAPRKLKEFSNVNLRVTVTSSTNGTSTNGNIPENAVEKNYKTITNSKIRMPNPNRLYPFSNGLMEHYLPARTIRDIADNSRCKHIKFHSSFDAFRKIVSFEGISHLYTGLAVTLWMAVPATVLYYSTYDLLRNYLVTTFDEKYFEKDDQGNEKILTQRQKNIGNAIAGGLPAIAGMTGRVFAQSVISPLELLRTQMMAQTIDRNLSIFAATQANIQQRGFKSLWKGLIPTLWRDVPFSGTYWMGYEFIKDQLLIRNANENGYDIDSYSSSTNNNDVNRKRKFLESRFGVSFVSGAAAGMFSTLITQPFDVIKTRRQSVLIGMGSDNQTSSNRAVMTQTKLFAIWREIYRNEGMNGLYAGIGARMARVPLACAVMVSTYEVGKKLLQSQVNDP